MVFVEGVAKKLCTLERKYVQAAVLEILQDKEPINGKISYNPLNL